MKKQINQHFLSSCSTTNLHQQHYRWFLSNTSVFPGLWGFSHFWWIWRLHVTEDIFVWTQNSVCFWQQKSGLIGGCRDVFRPVLELLCEKKCCHDRLKTSEKEFWLKQIWWPFENTEKMCFFGSKGGKIYWAEPVNLCPCKHPQRLNCTSKLISAPENHLGWLFCLCWTGFIVKTDRKCLWEGGQSKLQRSGLKHRDLI